MFGSETRRPLRVIVILALAAVGSAAGAERAIAQLQSIPLNGLPVLEPLTGYPPTVATTASGPFLPIAAWDQTLAPNQRFIILINFQSDAVLDRETGLVWARRVARYADEREIPWNSADVACHSLTVGNRLGWRLPTGAELATLFDLSRPRDLSSPRLPDGHPFVLQPGLFGTMLWTGEPLFDQIGSQTRMWVGWLEDGSLLEGLRDNGASRYQALCVRDQR